MRAPASLLDDLPLAGLVMVTDGADTSDASLDEPLAEQLRRRASAKDLSPEQVSERRRGGSTVRLET